MTTKPFDCVEMVEAAQAEIQDKLEATSREEQLAFWQMQTEKLRERQRQAQSKRLSQEDGLTLSCGSYVGDSAEEAYC